MHMQLPPSREAKLVRCTRGSIHDVIIDMNPESPTFLRHCAVELAADKQRALHPAVDAARIPDPAGRVRGAADDGFYAPDLGVWVLK
jgi:hypothetical protein